MCLCKVNSTRVNNPFFGKCRREGWPCYELSIPLDTPRNSRGDERYKNASRMSKIGYYYSEMQPKKFCHNSEQRHKQRRENAYNAPYIHKKSENPNENGRVSPTNTQTKWAALEKGRGPSGKRFSRMAPLGEVSTYGGVCEKSPND